MADEKQAAEFVLPCPDPEGCEIFKKMNGLTTRLAAAEAECDGATCISKETLIATETERDEALGRLAALRRDLASRDTEIACHRSMRKALDRIVQDFVAKWQERKG